MQIIPQFFEKRILGEKRRIPTKVKGRAVVPSVSVVIEAPYLLSVFKWVFITLGLLKVIIGQDDSKKKEETDLPEIIFPMIFLKHIFQSLS